MIPLSAWARKVQFESVDGFSRRSRGAGGGIGPLGVEHERPLPDPTPAPHPSQGPRLRTLTDLPKDPPLKPSPGPTPGTYPWHFPVDMSPGHTRDIPSASLDPPLDPLLDLPLGPDPRPALGPVPWTHPWTRPWTHLWDLTPDLPLGPPRTLLTCLSGLQRVPPPAGSGSSDKRLPLEHADEGPVRLGPVPTPGPTYPGPTPGTPGPPG